MRNYNPFGYKLVELKPILCLMCGKQSTYGVSESGVGEPIYFVECKSCKKLICSWESQEDAIKMWNLMMESEITVKHIMALATSLDHARIASETLVTTYRTIIDELINAGNELDEEITYTDCYDESIETQRTWRNLATEVKDK